MFPSRNAGKTSARPTSARRQNPPHDSIFSVSRIRTGGSGSAELACQANRRTAFRKQTHRRNARSGIGRAALIIFGATAYLERTETVCFHPAYMFRYTKIPDNFSDPTAVPLGHRPHFQIGPPQKRDKVLPEKRKRPRQRPFHSKHIIEENAYSGPTDEAGTEKIAIFTSAIIYFDRPVSVAIPAPTPGSAAMDSVPQPSPSSGSNDG